MTIETVKFPIKHGDVPVLYVKLPGGKPPFSYGFSYGLFSYGVPANGGFLLITLWLTWRSHGQSDNLYKAFDPPLYAFTAMFTLCSCSA